MSKNEDNSGEKDTDAPLLDLNEAARSERGLDQEADRPRQAQGLHHL